MKQCIQCRVDQEDDSFQIFGPHKVRMRVCKTCYQENRKTGKKSPWTPRDRKLNGRYGLTSETFEELRKKQDYACFICKKTETLFVDHCHGSGKVRGLLCNHCNLGIGHFFENIALLEQAILYLESNDIVNINTQQ